VKLFQEEEREIRDFSCTESNRREEQLRRKKRQMTCTRNEHI
jgi:hypothetical protein